MRPEQYGDAVGDYGLEEERASQERIRNAAPEMLEMLKHIAACVPDLDWTGAGCCPFCDVDWKATTHPPCKLKELIAKAEGR